ncbi:MAG: hypothetical protein CFE23_04825 [Flavobacterium sp. BFFFF1]|uniref:McrB family protein n=1 Tax=Flavobacterium sp. BFFFF1 TaxID=2015557 RepID=UPI000BD327B6|nr:AAA family ATPase [Flavobacterium sp. BFFFF1]OYU81413.1 MAG: hypothetical protein CFE23_04825 [Flavobacterium sp. BFFFF1]
MIIEDISAYLNDLNKISRYKVILNEEGGFLTFSNSGRRDSIKSFSLGIKAFIQMLEDINSNISVFQKQPLYDEHTWRDWGNTYFKDPTANSMITVQTRSQISTLNKLIAWANKVPVEKYDEKTIYLDKNFITNTIEELKKLLNLYKPKSENSLKPSKTEILLSEKELKHFAFKSFKILIDKFGSEEIIKKVRENDSKINDTPYAGLKIKPYFGSGNLIGVFDNPQNKQSLSSANTARFFEEDLGLNEYPNAYFTTQWGDVEGEGVLSFNNLQKFISDLSNGVLEAFKNDGQYSLQSRNVSHEILQTIFYGAPGTGKSHKIESILKDIPEKNKERITFHPEFDYSSFVGGYKPSTEEDEIKYKFVPQVFTKIYVAAWKNPQENFYLAIEEINRGNCAEIFGDLFQLLDRNSNYSISPSKELSEHLNRELGEGKGGIEGGKMKLPRNLHILASMNTSDQSLFPMDSAFKRRWAWEYIPINLEEYNEDRSQRNDSFSYIVILDENRSFKWIDFIGKANEHIKRNPNLGSDKCIGNYFIKPNQIQISLEEFINKAIFYLWIDVFKDEEDSIFEQVASRTSYEDFFPIASNGKSNLEKLLEFLKVEVINNTDDSVVAEEKEETSEE